MIELTETLLPDLPTNLNWVKGVFYIVEAIFLFSLLLSPFLLIFTRKKRRR